MVVTPLRLLLKAAISALALYVLLFAPRAVGASRTDVVPARTGGFGEMTCQQCHWENPLNEPSGRLTIDGVPATYTPGEQYLITVRLARPGLGRAGFQMSARDDSINMTSGSNAGTLASSDATTRVATEKLVSYIQHTQAGTAVKDDGRSWMFAWTAPEDGPVIFHAAANAANDDDSPLGDYIYTAVLRSRPAVK